jgi:hypothetical protein
VLCLRFLRRSALERALTVTEAEGPEGRGGQLRMGLDVEAARVLGFARMSRVLLAIVSTGLPPSRVGAGTRWAVEVTVAGIQTVPHEREKRRTCLSLEYEKISSLVFTREVARS